MGNKKKIEKEGNKPSRASIIKVFKEHPRQIFNYKQVASRLNLGSDSKKDILRALATLSKNKIIEDLGRGKYRYIYTSSMVEGKLELTMRGAGFVICEELEEDIFIAPRDLNRAFHGDTVRVSLYAQRNGKKLEGEIVEILERRRSEFVGIIEQEKNYAFLIPDDKRMYVDIFIPQDKLNGVQDGFKAVVEITDWPESAKNPFGKVTHVLGKAGENETEMTSILAEFEFPLSFPKEVEKEAEKIPDEIPESEIKKRRDFRNITTFTIDPHDAKDFDDALSIQKLKNGHWEIGVHIADVSYYVKPNTALGREAEARATSIYLVDRVIPMLPEKLSNGICSLVPNQDRLTFSAVFEMDEDGKVYNEWFGRTIIHSDRRFAYEEAQEVLENAEGDYVEELMTLNAIAKNLKEKRFKNGAISFETAEVKFRLDEKGAPIEVFTKVRKDAHKLIEEFMLLANKKVATYVSNLNEQKGNYPFIYRVHDSPNDERISDFTQLAKRFGYTLKTDDDKSLAASFNRLLEEVEGKPEQNIIQQSAIRTMAKAYYTAQKTGHYGLAFSHYSHFTSPIRRYPDLLAHRQLDKYLNKKPGETEAEIEEQAKHSSTMEQKAVDAERASIKYKQAEYLNNYIGQIFVGMISGVTEWGIYVEIIENKCEGMIRLNTINDDYYEYDEKGRFIVGKRRGQKYMLGDIVKVKVKNTDLVKRTIDFILVTK